MQLLISLVIAFVTTVVLVHVLHPLAIRIHLVDIPGGRKTHSGPVPLIGGISMFGGFSLAVLFLPVSLASHRALFAGSALLVLVGMLDDFNEMSAKTKLMLQIVASLIMVYVGRIVLQDLGNLLFLGDIHVPASLTMIVTVVAILGILNAVNMTDGLDGLAGSVTWVELALLAYLAFGKGYAIQFDILVLLLASLAGFLWFNFPFSSRKAAKIFMGDAGSLFLGFVLAWYLISLSQAPLSTARPVTFLWIMAVPLFDATDAILRRVLSGCSPFQADTLHSHHLLQRLKLSKTMIVMLMTFAATVMGCAGIIADRCEVSPSIMFISFLIAFVMYRLLNQFLWSRIHHTQTRGNL